jgi:hypothetical protein
MPLPNQTMKAVIAASLLLLVAATVSAKPRTEYRDFSQKGPEYRALEHLRFAATDATYQGTETITVAGVSYSASKYSVRIIVNIETMCGITVQAYERVAAIFDILVADDKNNTVRDYYLRAMNDAWGRKEYCSNENCFDFHVKENFYAISATPQLHNIKGYYFVWVNSRIVKIVFKGFEDPTKGGFGIMDAFTRDNLRMKLGDAELLAYEYGRSPQKRFLKLYRDGFFGLVKTA